MFARTARLTLRPDWPEDAAALAAAIAFPEVAEKTSNIPFPYGLGEADAFLARPRHDGDLFCFILAHEQAGGAPRLVGGVGIHHEASGPRELGYWLTPDAWGRGYATEAGGAMLRAARHGYGMRRLQAGCFTDNPASRRVLDKLGFRATGEVVEQPSVARGRTVSCARMTIDLTDREGGRHDDLWLAA